MRSRETLNNSGVKIIDEPFHRMRNRIIADLQIGWQKASYWGTFRDQDLLSAVMRTMQLRGELVCRPVGSTYEWSVPGHVEPRKIALHDIPR